ncbi:MAG: ketose-bisphosphate aldolase [Propionicimonas sp.]
MSLVSGTAILEPAREHGFAVPAFNLSDYGMVRAAIDVCEELGSPLMIALGPKEGSWVGPAFIPSVLALAHASSIPIALHWDHGANLGEVVRAIQAGYTSVMIDASRVEYEENIRITSEVVRVAHSAGVSVEAELGTIGATVGADEGGTSDIIYTDPEQAVDFVERTGLDFLAIAIGTRHGTYPATLQPELKLDLLDRIAARATVPLVLHGGSDNPDDEVRAACTRGINKVNISTDLKRAFFDGIGRELAENGGFEPRLVIPAGMATMAAVARQKVEIFGAVDTVGHYRRH